MHIKSLVTGLLVGALATAAAFWLFGDDIRGEVSKSTQQLGKSVQQAGQQIEHQAKKIR